MALRSLEVRSSLTFSIELEARADGAVPSGVVFIPFCYAEARGEHAHESGAGSVREDPGVQVSCGKGGGGGGRGCRMIDRL